MIKQHKHLSKAVVIILLLSILTPLLGFSIKAADNPQQQWIAEYDSTRSDKATGISTDSNNNVIVTGFSDINGANKCYTIKYDQNGGKLFDISPNLPSENKAYNIAIDSEDNIIIVGCLLNSNANYDYYTVKYDESGNELWNKTYDSGGQDIAFGVAIDSLDNVIITGESSDNYYTIKYDESGAELWNQTYDSSLKDSAKAIAVDLYDNIIITGNVGTNIYRDWHTIKYDESGAELWSKTFGNGNLNSANGLAVDFDNNIVVVGTVYFSTNSNFYTIKYDENGNEIWHRSYDKSSGDSASDVTINTRGDIIVAGTYFETLKKMSYAVLKYDSNGNFLWSEFFDRYAEDDFCIGVDVDNLNKIIVTGYSKNLHNDFDYLTIKYGEKPLANFDFQPLQPTDINEIQFIDTSIDPAGMIVDWHWDFGDGSTSSIQNPVHQYTNEGTYTAVLIITDDDGSQSNFSKNIQVSNVQPTADFYFTSDNFNVIQFNDSSIDLDGIIVNWTWDFGDENISYASNPIHQYTNTGAYDVDLAIIDDDGSTDFVSKVVIISPEPSKVTGLTVIDAKDGKLNLSWVEVNNVAIDHYNVYRNDSILTSVFGILYQDTGLVDNQSYSYQVSAVSIYGLEGEKSDVVNGSSTASISENGSDSGDNDSGGGSGDNSSGGGTDGDKQIDNGNPHQIATPNQAPVANSSANEPYLGYVGEELTFNASYSYDPDGVISLYYWDFGDGKTGYGRLANHTYLVAGTYNVILTVTDNFGVKDSCNTLAVIRVPNRAPLSPNITGPKEGAQKKQYSYNVNSVDEDNDYLQYAFVWDDGQVDFTEFAPSNTSIVQNHTWNASGRYVVKVNATDGKLYSDTIEYVVFIDAIEVFNNSEAIGYLKDIDGDGIYDVFYSYSTGKETPVKVFSKNIYLLDLNGDGKWDALYDIDNKRLTDYNEPSSTKSDKEFPLLLILIIIPWILIILLIILLLLSRRKNEDKKSQENGSSSTPVNDINTDDDMEPSSPYIVSNVENFIDSLPDI